jgi:rhamnosyltransferase
MNESSAMIDPAAPRSSPSPSSNGGNVPPVERCVDVCAVVVTFNPEFDPLRALLRALHAQVGRIFLIDNGSTDDVAAQLPPEAANAIEFVRNAQNLGIAAAQNQGAARALAWSGCRYVLLSDQDSLPSAYMVWRLRQTLERDRNDAINNSEDKPGRPFGYAAGSLAAVGPWSIDIRSGARAVLVVDPKGWPVRWLPEPRPVRPRAPPQVPYEVSFLIASGCLIPAGVLKTLGGMRSNYFIDHVDTEWCLRARAAGYRLFIVPDAILNHRLGDSTQRVWFFGFRHVAHHSPLRDYYMFRNTILMLGDVSLTSPWRLHLLVRLVLFAAYFVVFGNRRIRRMRFMALGVAHGLRRRSGRLQPDTLVLDALDPTSLDPVRPLQLSGHNVRDA